MLDDGLQSSFLVSLLIRNSSVLADLSQYQDAIDKYTPSEEDVNAALVDRYLAWNQADRAEEAAQRALTIAPESAHSLFIRGMAAHNLAVRGDWRKRADRWTEAIDYYSKALAAAECGKFAGLLPEIYCNRGRAYGAVGKATEAADDFRAGVHMADRPSLYAEGAIAYFLSVEDFESAKVLVPTLDAETDNGAFCIAVASYHDASEAEKDKHFAAVQRLADRASARAVEARFFCVQWAIDAKDFDRARACVPETFIEQYPFQGLLLRSWIELESGHEEDARKAALLAFDSDSRGANKQEISVLGRLLARLRDYEKALPLFEQAATPGVLDEDTKRLIECANGWNATIR